MIPPTRHHLLVTAPRDPQHSILGRLRARHHPLLLPVVHGQTVVVVLPDGRQEVPRAVEGEEGDASFVETI